MAGILARLASFAVALLHTAVAPCQQVHTVGPGQTFATIGAAIAAAAAGDTVLVVGGSYLEHIDIDKSLQLVGQGALLRTAFPGSSLRVHDLGPNQPVVVRGFTLQSLSGISMALSVERCEGPVSLHDLANQGGAEMWSLLVDRSVQVHVARALLLRASATDSVVAFEQCVVDPSSWAPGIWSIASTISLVQCSVHGAFVPGMAAVLLDGGGTLLATRSDLLGTGTGSFGQPAIQALAGGTVLLDPSTTLGAGGSAPPITGTVASVFEFASLRASSDGTVLTAAAHGPANEVFVTVFSVLAPAAATPLGLTWLDLATFTPLYAGIYDATTRNHFASIPHPPAPPGLTFGLQAVGLGAAGISLGLPTVLSMP
jgi:hypothetical protein